MTTQAAADDRLWGEWLARYLAHCRRELNVQELTELANAFDVATGADTPADFDARVSERVASVARPLVSFIATASSSDMRVGLARESAARLRAAARSG